MASVREGQTLIKASPGGRDEVRILTIDGPLTLNALFQFQEAWRAEDGPVLIFDLSKVPYVDSAAIGSLVNAYVSRSKNGRRTVLVGLADRVHSVLTMTKVDQLFSVYGSSHDAEEALRAEAAS
jgi:anti-anti-sigma factor